MRLPDDMRRLLDDSGRQWRVDEGKNHHQLRIDGFLVLVFPKGKSKGGRHHVNAVSKLKRFLRFS